MDEWNKLSMADRAKYIRIAVANGITNLGHIRDSYNSYAIGGGLETNTLVNKFEDGGPEYTEAGYWDVLTSLGRVSKGTRKYSKDVPFNTAFRDARNSGADLFVWGNNRYTTDIKPDEFVKNIREAPVSTLRDIATNKLLIRNPDTYRFLSEEDRNKSLSENEFLQVIPYHKNINYNEVNAAVEALYNEGLTTNQILGMLGNSLVESGWRNISQKKGPAVGYYQMEPTERKKYLNWVKANNLKESLANESIYIARMFNSKDIGLFTPYSGAISITGSDNIDYSKFRTAGRDEYRGVTTEDAFKSWNDGTIDGATTGFMQLFERAGNPHLDRRKFIANILLEDPNINFRK